MKLRIWATLARQFRGSGRLVIISVALSILQAALLVPVAVIVRHVFDRLIPAHDAGAIVASGGGILALYLASAGLGLCNRYTVLVATKRSIARLREALLERVLTLPRSYFDRRSQGTLHSTIVQDSERLDVVSSALVAQVMPALIVSFGLSVVMFAMNAVLFLVLLCIVPVLLALGRFLGRAVRDRYAGWQRSFDTFSTQTQLALRALTLMKASGAERDQLRRRASEVRELSEAGRAMVWRQDVYALVQGAVAVSAGVVVLVVGGRAVAKGSMTLGELLSFYALVALLLRQVNVIITGLPQAIGGYESVVRLAALLETDEPEPYSGCRAIQFRGELAVEDVTFGYGDEPLLHDVSLEVAQSERVSIVGPNGAGKSTLLNLMLGLYRPGSGRLTADGVPFDELDLGALRRSVGVLLQEPLIFPTSIRENIAYGRPDATLAEIRAAARWATADEFIDVLPDGYDSLVGDDGGLLSGGQRQRIALARALIGRPALIILDEPTTHLDDASIARLLENLRAFPGAPAIVTITHDPDVARMGDRAYRIRDGRILAEETGGGQHVAAGVAEAR